MSDSPAGERKRSVFLPSGVVRAGGVVPSNSRPRGDQCGTPGCDEERVSPYFCGPHQDRMDRIRASFEAEERRSRKWNKTTDEGYSWT